MCKTLSSKVQCGVRSLALSTQGLHYPSSCLLQLQNLTAMVSHMTTQLVGKETTSVCQHAITFLSERTQIIAVTKVLWEEKKLFEPNNFPN